MAINGVKETMASSQWQPHATKWEPVVLTRMRNSLYCHGKQPCLTAFCVGKWFFKKTKAYVDLLAFCFLHKENTGKIRNWCKGWLPYNGCDQEFMSFYVIFNFWIMLLIKKSTHPKNKWSLENKQWASLPNYWITNVATVPSGTEIHHHVIPQPWGYRSFQET